MIIWNPWHGCHKVSEGCQHCYMYFLDRMRGIDTSMVTRNAGFDMPLRRGRDGKFKIAPGMELLVGLSTDFFVEEADAWRDEAALAAHSASEPFVKNVAIINACGEMKIEKFEM